MTGTRRFLPLLLAAFLATPLVTAPAAAAGVSPTPAVPVLHWGACAPGSAAAQAGGFDCATAGVPLDYRHPRGRSISLSLVRRPATGPGPRIGTLFLNPGGPGGMGTVQIPAWIAFLPAGLQERFDVVSWDPRGIGASNGVQCFDSAGAEKAFLGDLADFPVGAAAQRAYVERWKQLGQRCAEREGDLLQHVSTAETARDLDLLRQAVGDRTLSYIGLSYGTYLGATYANLFPDRVRAMVLDGNVAPSAWTATGPGGASRNISARIGSDASAAVTLADLLTFCGRSDTAHCPFSAGSPAATTAKFDALFARLATGPIQLGAVRITYARLLGQLSDALDIVTGFATPVTGGGSTGWTGVGAALQEVWTARNAPVPPAAPTPPGPPAAYAGPEQTLSVICGESPSPGANRFPALARAELARNGPIGLASLWSDEPCSTWPARSPAAYSGPWDRPTARPILVIGNTTDPSTPYANSSRMVAQLHDARLLTVQGYGHTAFLNPSACASAAQVSYLVDGVLPAPKTVCRQDAAPFASISP